MSNLSSNDISLDSFYNFSKTFWYTALAISITGVLANTLVVLVAHVKDPLRCFKTPSSWFMYNIGIIDVVASTSYTIICTIRLVDDTGYAKVEQRILTILGNISFRFSFITCPAYFVLSAERFCGISFPFWHRTRITTRVCWYTICALWTTHFMFESLVTIFYLPIDKMELMDEENNLPHFIYTLLFFIASQFLSFATFIPLRKQRNEIFARQGQSQAVQQSIIYRLENEKRFMWTVTIVCFVAGVTLLPIIVFQLYVDLFDKDFIKSNSRYTFFVVFLVLATINFAVNPFVYLWRLPKYKRTFKILYCKK